MPTKGIIATVTRLGRTAATVALLLAAMAAHADELADVRSNQELLQKRLDQLAQAPPPGAPGAPTFAGSFPRSFLIPGTDTSIRVGGAAIARITWFLRGVQPSADLFGQGNASGDRADGGGGTSNLPVIPLNGTLAHSKSAAFFISGKNTRVFIDARTPTAWGTAQAFVEWDFGTTNNDIVSNGQFADVPNNPARLNRGYAALGPVLLGVANGSFADNDSDLEWIDFGGAVGGPGRPRTPQLRYTWETPWKGITVIAALEQPASEFVSPVGFFRSDYTSAVTLAACGTTGALATAGTPINVACVPLGALFDAAQAREPAAVLAARIDQPWGHLRVGAVIRDATLNDGFHIDRTWIGYGGAISGDVKPFPEWSPKDDIAFSATVGEGIGGYILNAAAVATNFGGVIGGQNPLIVGGMTGGTSFNTLGAGRTAYDALVRGATITAFAAKLGYQHWWTPQLRSNIDFSMVHQDVPNVIVTPGVSGKGGTNKELNSAHVNLLWSPVAFVTTGVEYSWGHRIVTSNAKGDSHLIQGLLRVNF